MKAIYPERFQKSGWPDDTPLRDYTVEPLILDSGGNTLSGPTLDSKGDVFTLVERRHDLECLVKPLPVEVIRKLGEHRRVKFGDFVVERPRRDDLFTFKRGSGKRKLCVYGAEFLLGKKPVVLGEAVDDFVCDLRKFIDSRPIVGSVAKRIMWMFINNNDLVRIFGVPYIVSKLFYEHGRGGNMDTSVIGTTIDTVKVDQKMSYLTVMSQVPSPTENLLRGREWVDDFKYDPNDSYGIYDIDCWIDEKLSDSPVSIAKGGTFVGVVGKLENIVVLKPTMDVIKLLESKGMAKVIRINWAWRLHGSNPSRPYADLYDYMLDVRGAAIASAHFFKQVAAALWGLTLQTYVEYDDGRPVLVGGYWFNPIVGLTVTDMMRAVNFRMKLASGGKVSSEVVDALTGPIGSWYDETTVKVKGPNSYTHINALFHVAPGDDRLNLLERLSLAKGRTLTIRRESRYGLSSMWKLSTSRAIKEALGALRDIEFSINIDGSKRKFPKEIRGLKISELASGYLRGMPYSAEELKEADIQSPDWNARLLELLGGEEWLLP